MSKCELIFVDMLNYLIRANHEEDCTRANSALVLRILNNCKSDHNIDCERKKIIDGKQAISNLCPHGIVQTIDCAS